MEAAAKSFLSIFGNGELQGSSQCIQGGYKCVCFSDAPISKLATIIATPNAQGMRYKPFGVMVSKPWLFSKGGRPAIYQLRDEYKDLPESQRFRHVTYDPIKGPDFSWEREWRIHADKLPLDPTETTLIVPNRQWEDRLRNEFASRQFITSVQLGRRGAPSSSFKWHFIALEDLGVPLPDEGPKQGEPSN